MSGARPPSHDEQDSDGLALQTDARGLVLVGSRVLLYSQIAVEMLRKQLVHQVGEDLARAVVAQAGRSAGFNDAQLLLQERAFGSVEDRLEMQYRVLKASGFGQFEVVSLAVDLPTKDAYIRVACTHSPEAESHRRLFGTASVPACWHLIGYSTGWVSAMTGLQLLSIESRCVARGDALCEFETLPYADFMGPEAVFWKRVFESTSTSVAQEIQEKLTTIQRQMEIISTQRIAIAELSTPILQVADGLLVLPIVGRVDSARAQIMIEKLLFEVTGRRAHGVIVDVTGVETLDVQTANNLLDMARAARLLGARVILTGISPSIADVIVSEGIDLAGIMTYQTIQEGIRHLQARARRP